MKEEIVGTREEEEDRPDSQRRKKKKKPLQKKDDRSKGLEGGQQYIKTDGSIRSKCSIRSV
jgi:hypothetical protein